MLLIFTIVVLTIAVYWYGTRTFSYWVKRGIKHDPPVPFFGTAKRQLLRQISYSNIYDEMYRKYPKEKYVGYYFSTRPLLILRDPEVIKRVLVTDFQYFYSRSVFPLNDGVEPLLDHLFACTGDLWKLVRQRLTPAFTSGKLKAMFPLIVTRAEKLLELASTESSTGTEVDVRDLMARYTTDFIGACGFGLDTEALDDKNSIFRKLGHRMFNNTTSDSVRMFCKYMMPTLFKHLHFVSEFVEKNLIKLVTDIMKEREFKPAGRNDFIDLMLELKTKGKITGDSMTNKNPDGTPCVVEREFDDLLIVAQVSVFFAAGFETSSTSSSYLLHVLAHHPEHQEKCQKEIDDVLARYDNTLSYDAVKEMKYLAMCFSEGLRLFAPFGYLMRECEKPYTIPDTDITLNPGVQVIIPVQSLHMDPEHWDEPEQFRPERFHPDNGANIKKHTYLPFGEGPRNCIGERLGTMQSMAGVAALLSQFTFTPGKKTVRHPPIDPAVFIVQSVAGGLPLLMTRRKKIQ